MDIQQDALITPFRALASKHAQKAYLGTFLFIATSSLMLCLSSVAYGIFYYKFIPQVGLERVVHLQFGYVEDHLMLCMREKRPDLWLTFILS